VVKCGKNRGHPYLILTPMKAWTDRDDTGDLIFCPMLCYSNGTDHYVNFS